MKKLTLALITTMLVSPTTANTIQGTLWVFPDADYSAGLTYNAPDNPDWGNALNPQASGDFATVFQGLKLPGDYSGGSTFVGDVLSMSVTGTPIALDQVGNNSDFWLTEFSGGYPTGNMAHFQILTSTYYLSPTIAGFAGEALVTMTGFEPTMGNYNLEVQLGNFWNYNGEHYNNWTSMNWTADLVSVPAPGAGLSGLLLALLVWSFRWVYQRSVKNTQS